VDFFKNRNNTKANQGDSVNNVVFRYRYGNVLSELLVKFLVTDTVNTTISAVEPLLQCTEIHQITASKIIRGNTLF
jgi:hypothetical protein